MVRRLTSGRSWGWSAVFISQFLPFPLDFRIHLVKQCPVVGSYGIDQARKKQASTRRPNQKALYQFVRVN
jgi:hypothetical protein